MSALRAVVVDDERLARSQLIRMLGIHPEVEVVAEAASAEAALEAIGVHKPDVVFLDVQMPGGGGFEVVSALQTPAPAIVFVTAFDAFAVRAFEVNALDYLMKPVRPDRLSHAVERLRALPAASVQAPPPEDEEALRPLELTDRLLLELKDRMEFVGVQQLACLTAADDYTELHLKDGRSALVLSTLRTWERRLPAQHFVRVHRSAILQFDAVKRLEPWSNGGFLAHVEGRAEAITISRRHASVLRARLT